MGTIITLAYGAGSYAALFLTFLYAIGFLGNVLVPKSLDSGPAGSLGTALLVDVGLLALFAVQHSVMARPAFKRLITTVVSPAAERSTYVLASCSSSTSSPRSARSPWARSAAPLFTSESGYFPRTAVPLPYGKGAWQ